MAALIDPFDIKNEHCPICNEILSKSIYDRYSIKSCDAINDHIFWMQFKNNELISFQIITSYRIDWWNNTYFIYSEKSPYHKIISIPTITRDELNFNHIISLLSKIDKLKAFT